jgi:hypothetical protein
LWSSNHLEEGLAKFGNLLEWIIKKIGGLSKNKSSCFQIIVFDVLDLGTFGVV